MSKHDELKRIARKMLRERGFKDSEIHEEFKVKEKGMRKAMFVDVVGIKPNQKIAIECGKTPAHRIAQLRLFFHDVIPLPYMALSSTEQERHDELKAKYEDLLQRYNVFMEEKGTNDRHINKQRKGTNDRHINKQSNRETINVDFTPLEDGAICGDCRYIAYVGGAAKYRCMKKDTDLDHHMVETRTSIDCEEFAAAPREMRIKMQQYVEVGITTTHGDRSVQIPAQIWEDLEIEDGDKILWIRKGRRDYTFRKLPPIFAY